MGLEAATLRGAPASPEPRVNAPISGDSLRLPEIFLFASLSLREQKYFWQLV